MRLIVTLYAACVAADGINAVNIIPGKACGLQTEVKTADRSLSASDIMRTYSGRSKDCKIVTKFNIFFVVYRGKSFFSEMSCLIIEDDARFREVKAKIKAARTTSTTAPRVGNSTLYYNDTEMTYFQAKEKCRDLGSDLVEMRTEEEWDEVRTHVSVLRFRVVQKRHD